MPQENEKTKKDVEYFFVAPNGKVYKNPYNLTVPNIRNIPTFKEMTENGGGTNFHRFAVDPESGVFYVQDDNWREMLSNGDDDAWKSLNPALEFVKTKFDIKNPKKQYGDPAYAATLNKLSNYNIAWDYIEDFYKREDFKPPADAAVVEYYGEDTDKDSRKSVIFYANGFSYGNVQTKGPTFAIDKRYFISPDGKVDYAEINHDLIVAAFRGHEGGQGIIEKVRDEQLKMYNPRKFNVFFAAYSKNGPEVHKANDKQAEHIQDEDSLRATLREAKCLDCGKPNLGTAEVCSSCGSGNIKFGAEYKLPLVLFSFLPDRKQLIFQNHRPEEMERYSQYKPLLDKIKSTISSAYDVNPNELIESFDASAYTPFLSMMSSYKVVWNYIINVMCPKVGKEARDITVVEAPVPMKGAVAVFLPNQQTEEEKTEGGMEYRIGHGIAVNYPFIMIDVRIKNTGFRFGAMVHEYKHFLDIGDSVPDAMEKFQDPDESFLSYIRHPHEQSAHYDQMFHALMIGMNPMEVLDMFAPKNAPLLQRAEYGKILDNAIFDYKEYKKKRASIPRNVAPTQPKKDIEARLSEQIPAILDWWNVEIQDDRLSKLDIRAEERSNREKGFEGLESLVRTDHDKQGSSLKPLEQLLQESRI